MRIRSIKPDFYRSSDISTLDWHDRFLFIALWSYVDDNGVGIDKLSSITADLFADDLHADPRETFARVSRGLQQLFETGRITRYTVDGKPYLHITNWKKHQKIDRPNKDRYPLPTCENAQNRDTLATPSRHPREDSSTGTGDQGIRGTGDKYSCASADAERDSESPSSDKYDTLQAKRRDKQLYEEFCAWYDHYPRKRGKGQAMKAYKKARKTASAEELEVAVQSQSDRLIENGMDFCPYPATWLNGERWDDDTTPADEGPLRGPHVVNMDDPANWRVFDND